MQALDSFLDHHVDRLVAGQQAPVDLSEIARRASAVVEVREMIPEASMTAEGEGFRIYLQSNFADLQGIRVRQRFSFAHEIAHTFFFELRDGTMKPRRDAPTGERLEAACHKAAGLLLVPKHLLKQALRRCDGARDAEFILRLTREFDVSAEVIMRRLWDLEAYGNEFAPVLVRRGQGDEFSIEFAAYAPWLRSLFPSPRRGASFRAWFGGTKDETATDADKAAGDETLVRKTPHGDVRARPVDISKFLRVYEITLRR